MTNAYVNLDSKITLLKNKLNLLSQSIQNPSTFSTKESYQAECSRILKDFYSNLDSPVFKYDKAKRDSSLLPSTNSVGENQLDYDYNLFWNQFLDNLKLLFMEMENLESLSISNFNFAMTEANRLISRLKSVSSKVGDYALYSKSTLSDIFLSRNSFNNLNNIDIQSQFLNEKECDINQEEGIVTLPIDQKGSKAIPVVGTPEINGNSSNGTAGNNHDDDRTGGRTVTDIDLITDNNPDTWFEYEKVVPITDEDEDPLILDIVMNFGSEQIINHVVVNPNNFGTKTVVNIDKIETSIDGKIYLSIKDDMPIAGYAVEDEENVFTLAPSTSKYSGQGIYTFTPRKARYLRVSLRQSEPYTIKTTTGNQLRYAIGIRDITAKALKFENKGELISKALKIGNNNVIKKVLLEASQTPLIDSELTNIKYSVSHDDGISWNEIQPKHLGGISGTTVKEILNYNNADSNAIKTETEISSIRLKISLEREDENFVEGRSSLSQATAIKSELHAVPTVSPFSIKLEKTPLDGKVTLIDPLFGSRGIKNSSYMIRHGADQSQDVFSNFPFKELKKPLTKITGSSGTGMQTASDSANNYLHVYVGGERWTQASTSDLSDSSLNGSTVFNFNLNKGELVFNSGSTGAESPPDNSPIMLHFSPERLFLGEQSNNHLSSLDFQTSNSKEDFKIINYGKEVSISEEALIENRTIHHMEHSNISSAVVIVGWTSTTFINGRDEFVSGFNESKFSVDSENGIIYLGNTTVESGLTCEYSYIPKTILNDNDWEWSGEGTLKKEISIKEPGWFKIDGTETITLGAVKKFGLSNFCVVKGTFVAPTGAGLGTEVPFLNGEKEFGTSTTLKRYSVDYENGEVHLAQNAVADDYVFNYFYTHYEAEYRIAREVDANHYTVDVAEKEVKISDGEIFKNIETPKTTESGKVNYYLVNYEYVSDSRTGMEELKNYFTPVVKDYLIKMLKKGVVF